MSGTLSNAAASSDAPKVLKAPPKPRNLQVTQQENGSFVVVNKTTGSTTGGRRRNKHKRTRRNKHKRTRRNKRN